MSDSVPPSGPTPSSPPPLPPPLPVPSPLNSKYRRDLPFAYHAARACVFSPFIAMLVGMLGSLASHPKPDQKPDVGAALVIPLFNLLLVLAGTGLGVAALFQVRRLGWRGILIPSICGISINALLLLAAGMLLVPLALYNPHPPALAAHWRIATTKPRVVQVDLTLSPDGNFSLDAALTHAQGRWTLTRTSELGLDFDASPPGQFAGKKLLFGKVTHLTAATSFDLETGSGVVEHYTAVP